MTDITTTLTYTADLTRPLRRMNIPALFITDARRAHRITVTVLRAGNPVDLGDTAVSGTVKHLLTGTTIPLSGSAQGSIASVTLPPAAYAQPGDTITTCALDQGAHISTCEFGAFGQRGVKSVNYPWKLDNMNLDVDGTAKLLREVKPKVAQFGLSVFLFPPPLKELEDTFNEVGCLVWEDCAHVLGLIAGGQFQKPFEDGVDIVSASTHKTFPGPNHGIVLGNGLSEENTKKIQHAIFPGVTSSHHLHAMAALAVTLAEMDVFGKDYAAQACKNARALGQALYERGVPVLCENLGFTRSHAIALDVTEFGKGKACAKLLEDANIICNKNMLPSDTSSVNPSGLRLGTQEMTRLGMKENEMDEVADFIARVVVKKEDPAKVKKEVTEFKHGFDTIQYCFNAGEPAYEYRKLVP